MSGVTAVTARSLRASAMSVQQAGTVLASALERLSDHDLAECARERDTERLYVALTEMRLALTKVGEGADADTVDRTGVLVVAPSRWRRRGWGRPR